MRHLIFNFNANGGIHENVSTLRILMKTDFRVWVFRYSKISAFTFLNFNRKKTLNMIIQFQLLLILIVTTIFSNNNNNNNVSNIFYNFVVKKRILHQIFKSMASHLVHL